MSDKQWTFNRGEWSEAYVFLRLLSSGRIYAGNSSYEKNENVYMEIINIFRYETDHMLEFKRIVDEAFADAVEASKDGVRFELLNLKDLEDTANYLYNSIKSLKADGKKEIFEVEKYLKKMGFSSPKTVELSKNLKTEYGMKTDIIITIGDGLDNAITTQGFSIKSHLGSPPTLFNAGVKSKFIYEVVGCDDNEMNIINGTMLSGAKKTIKHIIEHPKLSLNYVKTTSDFKENLEFIDLKMDQLISHALLIKHGITEKAESNDVKSITKVLSKMNPLNVSRPDSWYEVKMKDFLYASFGGLTASNPWDGRKRLSGGYIDVDSNGELLYYRAISDDLFTSFLFDKTYFDDPSRGLNKDLAIVRANAALNNRDVTETEIYNASVYSNGDKKPPRGDWGYIYKEDDKYYFNLNFQIKFRNK